MFIEQAVETVPAYPNICFVVDDYDNTFEDVVSIQALNYKMTLSLFTMEDSGLEFGVDGLILVVFRLSSKGWATCNDCQKLP